jgi:hypothetical protein
VSDLYLWHLDRDEQITIVLAYADNAHEAAEKVALKIATVNADPSELLLMERYLQRLSLPTPLDFSEGVASFQISLPRKE